jgi:hypothetical protein
MTIKKISNEWHFSLFLDMTPLLTLPQLANYFHQIKIKETKEEERIN